MYMILNGKESCGQHRYSLVSVVSVAFCGGGLYRARVLQSPKLELQDVQDFETVVVD